MQRILVALVTGAVALGISSCGSGDDGPSLATIQVTPSPVTLQQQQTAQLEASVLNSEGQLVTGIAVTFSSSDVGVASVSNTGLITAGHAGSASVLVKAQGIKATVPVTVTAVPNQVTVTPNPGVVPQNGTLQLVAVVKDLSGEVVPGAPVTYASSNTALATVSASGLVDPVGPAGQVNITVQSGTLNTTVPVGITQIATSLSVTPNPIRLGKSGTVQLRSAVLDLVGSPIAGAVFSYQSSNPALLTVSSGGLVQGKGLVGSGTVTVAATGLTTVAPFQLLETGSPSGVLDQSVPTPTNMRPYGIAVSSDGQILVVGSSMIVNGTMARATLTNRTFVDLPQGTVAEPIADADFVANGTTAWVSNLPGLQASEVTSTTGSVLFSTTTLASGNRFSVQLSQDGTQVYVGGEGEIAVLNEGTGAVVKHITIGSLALSMVPNPVVANHLFTTGEGAIQEVDVTAGTVRNIGGSAKNLAVSPDGTRLYLVFESTELRVVDAQSGATVDSWTLPCGAWGVAVSPDGQKLVATCSMGGQILLLDAANGALIQAFNVGGAPRRITFTADGLLALVTDEFGFVHIIR